MKRAVVAFTSTVGGGLGPLRLGAWVLVLSIAVVVAGCSPASPDDDDAGDGRSTAPPVPVSGVVTLDGNPLSLAVVTFMPGRGATYIGETDADGRYEIAS
jgi:hypothetical protein